MVTGNTDELLGFGLNYSVSTAAIGFQGFTINPFFGTDLGLGIPQISAITFPGDLDLDMKRFDLLMQVDLRAPLLAIQAVMPSMKARREGTILNISSIAGLNYFPGLMAYGMSKAALEHLTVSAAHQLRPFGIAVNTFRIDVPVASEGFVFNLPDADHSDWEPSEVAAEGIVWMLEQPPSYTGHNVGMARLRTEAGIMASRAQRPHAMQSALVTDTHLRPPN